MKKIIWLALAMMMFFPYPLFAVNVPSLYQAELPVMSQADDERIQAVKAGFQALLVKLTGDPAVLRRPEFKEAIQRANYFVSEYSYALPTPQASTYVLHVRYDEADINRLLRKSSVTFWGEDRPLILVWLAVTDAENATEIIGNETPSNILDTLKRQSSKYAIPLIYPMMDVADMSQVSIQDVTSMALPALWQAGKRYSPNGILVGKIAATDLGYESEWELVLDRSHWKWTLTDKTVDGVIDNALTEASQTLAKHFAVRSQ